VKSLTSIRGRAWASARQDPRSFEAVIKRARAASEAAGIPEYVTFGADVPFFVRPQDEMPPQGPRPRQRGGQSM
jgi:hypothetical protein